MRLTHFVHLESHERATDLVTVAELARHSRVETTRRYSLPSEADRQQAVDDLQIDF